MDNVADLIAIVTIMIEKGVNGGVIGKFVEDYDAMRRPVDNEKVEAIKPSFTKPRSNSIWFTFRDGRIRWSSGWLAFEGKKYIVNSGSCDEMQKVFVDTKNLSHTATLVSSFGSLESQSSLYRVAMVCNGELDVSSVFDWGNSEPFIWKIN